MTTVKHIFDDDVDCFDLKKIIYCPKSSSNKKCVQKEVLTAPLKNFFSDNFTFEIEICTTILKIPTSLLKKVLHYCINNSKYLPRLFSSKAMLTIQVQ